MDIHYFKTKWEGKPLFYKLKYLYSNFPEVALSLVGFGLIIPILGAYKLCTLENRKVHYLPKYKYHFKVIRDDDPTLEEQLKEKEAGRNFFPK